MKRSPIPHANAEIGLFFSRINGKSEVDRYYYGSLAYAKMTEEWHKMKMYQEEVM